MKTVFAMLILLTVSSLALAGEPPSPPRGGGEGGGPGAADGPGGGPPPRMQPGGPGGPGMRGPGMGGPGMGGPGMGGPGMGGPGGRMDQIDVIRGYFGVVEGFVRLSRDPTHAGIAAVIGAGDILKPRGADAGI